MLQQRIYTAIIGAAFLLTVTWVGGWYFIALLTLLAVLGYFEFLSISTGIKMSLYDLFGVALMLLLFLFGFSGGSNPELLEWMADVPGLVEGLTIGLVICLLFVPVVMKNRVSFNDVAIRMLGVLYIGGLLHYSLILRVGEHGGIYPFLALMLGIWGTDTAAFFVGRIVKGPKLWPSISPNKTLSGAIGGVVGAIILDLTLGWCYKGHGLSIPETILFAVFISVLGQMGDFVESALKRWADVKDSSSVLPGHGGLLDRFDSLLFAGPMAYHLIIAFLH